MKIVVGVALAFVAIVIGLSIYLTPNDFAACGNEPSDQKPCQKADAIVAVSGGDTWARTREAIKLYQHGWAPKLIFSGAAQDKTGPSNAEAMRREALKAGVANEDIITEELSATTKQNAENTRQIFTENDISSVILVTSAYHQRRASLEFKARAGQAVTVRNHPVMQDNQWSSWWWLTPTGWYLAIGEFVKIIAFYTGSTR
jgi:uncharacterized SAM-binding protein YcdF (DUF218 family)